MSSNNRNLQKKKHSKSGRFNTSHQRKLSETESMPEQNPERLVQDHIQDQIQDQIQYQSEAESEADSEAESQADSEGEPKAEGCAQNEDHIQDQTQSSTLIEDQVESHPENLNDDLCNELNDSSPDEIDEENPRADQTPQSLDSSDAVQDIRSDIIIVAETEPIVRDVPFESSTHVVGPEEVEIRALGSAQIVDDDTFSSPTLDFPIASVVVDSATMLNGFDTDSVPVSFAIGEPFVQEAEAVKPIYLRRRAVCLLSVMFFNATLILILLSVRDKKSGDEASTVPSPSSPDIADRRTIKEYILKHTNSSEAILDDATTNQYKALEFLAKEDIFYVAMNQELLYVQRYIEILVMLTISGKPHLILPEYVASRTDDDFIDTMHISLTQEPEKPGSIPEEISYLSQLRTLHLKSNGIGGEIPSEIGLLTNLVTIDLSDNEIEGTIPTELGELTRLKTINFNDNKLTGEVPKELRHLDLLELTLENNDLTGNLTF